MPITRVLPNSVLAPTRVTTRPFGRSLSGTERPTMTERQRGLGFGFGLGTGAGAIGSSGVTASVVSRCGCTDAADSAEWLSTNAAARPARTSSGRAERDGMLRFASAYSPALPDPCWDPPGRLF